MAAAGILTDCREPHADGYERITRHGPETELEPEALPGLRLRVADILG